MYESHGRVSCLTALVALVIDLFLCTLLPANPTITEFLSINDSVLADIDGEFNDWVELHNPTGATIGLGGYYLTDNDSNLTKWRLPSVNLSPGGYLVVFASGKDRQVASAELHTNFKLSGGGGEYLALVAPDGVTIINEFAPDFPKQFTDVSYGTGISSGKISTETPITTDHEASYIVPKSGEVIGGDWRLPKYNDDDWNVGKTAFGFGYAGQPIGEGGDMTDPMRRSHGTLYLRLPFHVDDIAEVFEMNLRMKYDDGFAAYLNGKLVAQENAPTTIKFDSLATGSEEFNDDDPFKSFRIAFSGHLVTGKNILAICGMNQSHKGSDFLILPELEVRLQELSEDLITGYFDQPTPGAPNVSAIPGYITDTRFNVDRGFFNEPFQLEITTETPSVEIRYTTDGTLPTEEHGTVYTEPLTIDKTTILQAAAFGSGFRPTNVDTQTYIFIDDILTQPNIRGYYWDSEMDPNIVNNPGTFTVAQGLAAIPTLSIVMDPNDLFGTIEGIYTHATQRAADNPRWEKRCSAEYFYHPDYDGPFRVGNGFQIDCGIAINGNYSRLNHNPKHSLRLKFKEEYGEAKLEFPIFPASPVDEYDTITIRTGHNQGWATGQASTQMMRNQYARDIQGYDPTHSVAEGNHIHLYLNGQYWGLYNFHERPDDSFAAEHWGGPKEEYDGFKGLRSGGSSQALIIAGNRDAWSRMFALANQDMRDISKYQAVLDYVDVDQLIDYMIGILYTGDRDGPTGIYPPAELPKNFYAIRRRQEGGRFRFFRWDSEFIFENIHTDMSERGGTENPAGLHKRLRSSPEYQLRFGDRVHKYFFNGGAFTPETQKSNYLARSEEISEAMVAESARWGDSKKEPPYTRDGNWVSERNRIVNNWMPGRHPVIINQFQTDKLYPNLEAPTFLINGAPQHGGPVPMNASLRMTPARNTIYYTTDGTDPRVPGSKVEFKNHTLIDEFASKRSIMPTDGEDNLTWFEPNYDDSGWPLGTKGAGYDRGATYKLLIDPNLDFFGQIDNMLTETIYMRVEFDLSDPSVIDSLSLLLRYDDGFVAYLNGTEIARDRAIGPPNSASLWNNDASASHDDALAVDFETFPVNQHVGLLRPGKNMLAIHGLNKGRANSDFLLWPKLVGKEITGGAIGNVASPTAMRYDGSLTLKDTGQVKARALKNGQWSALVDGTFLVNSLPAESGNLVISEFDYRPRSPDTNEEAEDYDRRKDFEFVELLNTGSRTVDLAGVMFIGGIVFDFNRKSAIHHIEPGKRILVVKNREAFLFRYPNTDPDTIAGEYGLQLSDDGEEIAIIGAGGDDIVRFTYNDRKPWPRSADGNGNTLILRKPESNPDPSDATNWRSKAGSPGTDDRTSLTSWLATNGLVDPNGDPDGNGITNMMAYAFGNDYAPITSVETIDVGGQMNNYLILRYRQNTSAEDIEIVAEISEDLRVWSGRTIVVSRFWQNDGIEVITVRNSVPLVHGNHQFVRLRILITD